MLLFTEEPILYGLDPWFDLRTDIVGKNNSTNYNNILYILEFVYMRLLIFKDWL